MRGELILNVTAQKYLLAYALKEYIDFSKRVYIAYGSTNEILLKVLGIKVDKRYIAGFFGKKLDVNEERPKPVVLDNGKLIDISEFDINKNDYFIKGANALWYEGDKKFAAVAAADPRGGTFGNFYVKASCVGAKVIIPVTHEKLIPFYVEATQDVDVAMGNKIAMLRFFYGEVFSEIEAFRVLFDLKAKVIAAGGIDGSEGSVVFLVEGDRVNEAIELANKLNSLKV